MKLPHLLLIIFLLGCTRAEAQLHLPTLPVLSGLPRVQMPLLQKPLNDLDNLAANQLDGLRQRLADARFSANRRTLTHDSHGELIVRERILAQPSGDAARQRLLAEPGVSLLETQTLDGLDLEWLILRADPALLARLRELDPDGTYDLEHIYLGSGEVGAAQPAASSSASTVSNTVNPTNPTSALRIGLIDSGIDARHAALKRAALTRFGCHGEIHPAAHGTAVASLLVGQDRDFQGALPGAQLLAADVYCDAPEGGAVPALAQALAWLAREHVGVVNVSLVGPANALLERAVAAAQARGMQIVAAVGNDGPSAPPLYPAAFPGVIGVTAVDTRRRVLPEAARGAQVVFAAPGSEMRGAAMGGGYAESRGTSFAAPLVAGLLAAARAQAASGSAAFEQVRTQAIDLGAPGRDPIYGWGLVGEALRSAY
ncbi:MAG TPA: S8 family serine peptidase [Burkholderiaceae bacterium]|jgi:subtilisin family serine protease